jgi:altronate dehydratase
VREREGEVAVRETFEQVAKEGGEQGVKNLVQFSKSYGIDAMRAAKVAPRITSTFVDRIAPEFAPGALRALARPEERAVFAKIDAELLPGALEAAARHPGVGAQVVDELGLAGVRASQRFDTDAMIQLARSAEARQIAVMPMAERKGLIASITQFIDVSDRTQAASVLGK